MFESGQDHCTCLNTKCPRHGNCKECIEHHKNKKDNPLTACKRLKRSNLILKL
ncbi:MAG: hypothetical protein E6344_12570 [Clostridium sp.]|uniref:hypothetical protein n=1 Tax=Clostridium culturomicium TaxID=1499683 RepID=UPI000A4EDC41|nr:hypothetical protein [Clostridium culturomicium]MDU4892004.1 hypothetical protein [Clostridium sp.]MDU7084525.1 hypothetical protein [Clostridium sp.]